jgi:hypothetical protein
MGLAVWLNLEGKDVVAFMFAGLLGFLAGTLVPAGSWAVYTSILVSYHLFLGWLVLTADHNTGFSLPIASTTATHLACLTLILALGTAHHFVPFFGIFRYGIAALAIFERGWLFSGNNNQTRQQDVPSSTPLINSTGDDYEEWLRHIAQQKPASRQLGRSLKAEYEQWLLNRAQNRPAEPSND